MVQFLVEVISLHRNHLLCLNVTILCDNAKFYFLRKGNEGEKGDKGEPVCFHSSLSSLPLMKNILCFFCVTLLIILPCCSPSHPPARPWLPDLRIGAFCNKAGLLCAPPLTAATFFQHFYSLWRESCRASVRCLIFFFFLLLNSFDVAAGVTKGKPGPPGQQVNKSFLIAFVWQRRVVMLRQQKPVAKSSLFIIIDFSFTPECRRQQHPDQSDKGSSKSCIYCICFLHFDWCM